MSNGTKVKKRDGRIESLDLDKMHLMVEEACTGLAGVSASQVEMKSGIQFYDGITTGEIQEILIKSASDLIDLDHPNYQFQVMGEAAYSPDGIKKLEDLGATEVIVAFRNTYEGGPDDRTLEGMIAEINWYAEEVINKSKLSGRDGRI